MSTTERIDEEVTTGEGEADLEETTVLDAGDVEEEGEEEEGEEIEVYQIGEHEITLDDFETMQKQQMLHKDYTQKRQAEAEEVKRAKENARQEAAADLQAHITALEEMIADLDDVDVDDLTNSEFQALERKRAKREKLLANAKRDLSAVNAKTPEEIQEEANKLTTLMPHWFDDQGQYDPSKADADIQLIIKTASDIGFDLVTDPDHRLYRVFYEAAKFRELSRKTATTGKRKVKSPSTKPATRKSSQPKSMEELFYGT